MEIIPQLGPVLALTLPFLAAMAALHLILFKPLLAYLDEREDTEKGARERATANAATSEERLTQIEERLAEARHHAASVRAEARAAAHEEESKIIAQARSEAEEKVQAAVQEIRTAAEAAKEGLAASSQALSADIAGQVLGRELH